MLPIERLKKSNTIDNLWLYILSILKNYPVHAWDIPKIIEREFNFKPGRITPYRVLYRLQQQGFVKSELKERRRVYKITEKGKEELKKAKKFYKQLIEKL